jgi:hypothetical protein
MEALTKNQEQKVQTLGFGLEAKKEIPPILGNISAWETQAAKQINQSQILLIIASKKPEVVAYLNEYNNSGTLRKTGEKTYGGIGEETKKRTLLVGELLEARKIAKETNWAKESNLIIENEYKKLAEKYNELEKRYKDIQTITNELKRLQGEGLFGKLYEFKNKSQITELKNKLAAIGDLNQIW